MIALLIQFTVFLSYVGYIYSKFGILDSISESWYRLEIYNQSYLFTLFCFLRWNFSDEGCSNRSRGG